MRTIKRDIVGAFIFSSDQKLLLGHSHQGGVYPGAWIVPGGGVEEGESLLDALKRETLEETGINIAGATVSQIEGALTGKSEKKLRGTGERVQVEMIFYNFKVILPLKAVGIQLHTKDDFIGPKWFSSTELQSLTLSPPTVLTLQRLELLDQNPSV